MIFPDTNQAAPSGIDDSIGIAQVLFVSQRLRYRLSLLTIQLLIGKIREIERPVMNDKRSPAVFMDPRPGIKRGGSSLNRPAIREALNNNVAPPFCWPLLDPVNVITIKHDLPQTNDC